jgi:hypothetical protein
MPKQIIALEADDYNPKNHRFDVLEKLKSRYGGFKITMFTVAWDIRYNSDKGGLPIPREEFKSWVNAVRHAIDDGWLEIAIHGLTHAPHEFLDLEPKLAAAKVGFAQKMLEDAKIPYVKIFKAPYWELRKDSKRAIEKLGFKVVEDGYYNWNIKDTFPVEKDLVIGHGHVQDEMGNGLSESLIRLMEIPDDYEWKFISEVI